jgi:hypothetical protein
MAHANWPSMRSIMKPIQPIIKPIIKYIPKPIMRYIPKSSSNDSAGIIILLFLFMCMICVVSGGFIYLESLEEEEETNCNDYNEEYECNNDLDCIWDESDGFSRCVGSNYSNYSYLNNSDNGSCTTTEVQACAGAITNQATCNAAGACTFTAGVNICTATATISAADVTECNEATTADECAAVMTEADGNVAACTFTPPVNICTTTPISACELASTDQTTCGAAGACSFTANDLVAVVGSGSGSGSGACLANQRVSNNICVSCRTTVGGILLETRTAGDDPSGGNTQCTKLNCRENWHVENGECEECLNAGIREPNDNPNTGIDTVCLSAKCTGTQKMECTGAATTRSCFCRECPDDYEADITGDWDLSPDDVSAADTTCVPFGTGSSTVRPCLSAEKVDMALGACVSCPTREREGERDRVQTYGCPAARLDPMDQQPGGDDCIHDPILTATEIKNQSTYAGDTCRRPVCTATQGLQVTDGPTCGTTEVPACADAAADQATCAAAGACTFIEANICTANVPADETSCSGAMTADACAAVSPVGVLDVSACTFTPSVNTCTTTPNPVCATATADQATCEAVGSCTFLGLYECFKCPRSETNGRQMIPQSSTRAISPDFADSADTVSCIDPGPPAGATADGLAATQILLSDAVDDVNRLGPLCRNAATGKWRSPEKELSTECVEHDAAVLGVATYTYDIETMRGILPDAGGGSGSDFVCEGDAATAGWEINPEWDEYASVRWAGESYASEENKHNWLPNHQYLIRSDENFHDLLMHGTNKSVYFEYSLNEDGGKVPGGDKYKWSYLKNGKWIHRCKCSSERGKADYENGFTNCKCAESQYLDENQACKYIDATCYQNGNYLYNNKRIEEGEFWNIKDPYCNFFDTTTDINDSRIQERCCVGCSHKVYKGGIPEEENTHSERCISTGDATCTPVPEVVAVTAVVEGCTATLGNGESAGDTTCSLGPSWTSTCTRNTGTGACVYVAAADAVTGTPATCTKDPGDRWGSCVYIPPSPDYAINWFNTADDADPYGKLIYDEIVDTDIPGIAGHESRARDPILTSPEGVNEEWRQYNLSIGFNSRPRLYKPTGAAGSPNPLVGGTSIDYNLSKIALGSSGEMLRRGETSNLFTCRRTNPNASYLETNYTMNIPEIGSVGDAPYHGVMGATVHLDEFKDTLNNEWVLTGASTGSVPTWTEKANSQTTPRLAAPGKQTVHYDKRKQLPNDSAGLNEMRVPGASPSGSWSRFDTSRVLRNESAIVAAWDNVPDMVSDGTFTFDDNDKKQELAGYSLLYMHKRPGGERGRGGGPRTSTPSSWGGNNLEICSNERGFPTGETWEQVKTRCDNDNCHGIWKDSPVLASCTETASTSTSSPADWAACAAVTDLSTDEKCLLVQKDGTDDGNSRACTYNDGISDACTVSGSSAEDIHPYTYYTGTISGVHDTANLNRSGNDCTSFDSSRRGSTCGASIMVDKYIKEKYEEVYINSFPKSMVSAGRSQTFYGANGTDTCDLDNAGKCFNRNQLNKRRSINQEAGTFHQNTWSTFGVDARVTEGGDAFIDELASWSDSAAGTCAVARTIDGAGNETIVPCNDADMISQGYGTSTATSAWVMQEERCRIGCHDCPICKDPNPPLPPIDTACVNLIHDVKSWDGLAITGVALANAPKVNWYKEALTPDVTHEAATDEELIHQCATVCSTERTVTGVSWEPDKQCLGFSIDLYGEKRGRCCLSSSWQGSTNINGVLHVDQSVEEPDTTYKTVSSTGTKWFKLIRHDDPRYTVLPIRSPCIDVDTPPGCMPQDCIGVDSPYVGCTQAKCTTDDQTPYTGCDTTCDVLDMLQDRIYLNPDNTGEQWLSTLAGDSQNNPSSTGWYMDRDMPYNGCTPAICTGVDTPYMGCIPGACTTDANTPPGCIPALCTRDPALGTCGTTPDDRCAAAARQFGSGADQTTCETAGPCTFTPTVDTCTTTEYQACATAPSQTTCEAAGPCTWTTSLPYDGCTPAPCTTDAQTPYAGCDTTCTAVDTPFVGCTTPPCTDVDTPYAGCVEQDCTNCEYPTEGEFAGMLQCEPYGLGSIGEHSADYRGCIRAPCTSWQAARGREIAGPYDGCIPASCTDASLETPYFGCSDTCTAVDTPFVGCHMPTCTATSSCTGTATDGTSTCDLDAATDGTAVCPAGCTSTVETPFVGCTPVDCTAPDIPYVGCPAARCYQEQDAAGVWVMNTDRPYTGCIPQDCWGVDLPYVGCTVVAR